MSAPVSRQYISFDEQASVFDRRAGLPGEVPAAIAEAVVELANLKVGSRTVDIGAGTGEIGYWLARGERDYVGIDRSAAMLDRFRQRLGEATSDAVLIQSDANAAWPVADASSQAVFGSRVFHLLDPDHVVTQAKRALAPGGVLISGRVERDADSARALMRRQMRALLVEHGCSPRKTRRRRARLWEVAASAGATPGGPVTAASWRVIQQPGDSLVAWGEKTSLGGITPPEDIRQTVLATLREWAISRWGGLDAQVSSTERYILEYATFD